MCVWGGEVTGMGCSAALVTEQSEFKRFIDRTLNSLICHKPEATAVSNRKTIDKDGSRPSVTLNWGWEVPRKHFL